MSAQWLNSSSDFTSRVAAAAEPVLLRLSRPEGLRRIRQILLVLFLFWGVLAVARIVWIFVPRGESPALAPAAVINPVRTAAPAAAPQGLDIERLRGWHLFGEAGAEAEAPPPAVATVRDGIEKDARKTRLNLKLRGIVASTEDGLGHAIIEHKSRQAVYAVEDKLPVPGRVSLAKVMPRQVILDNGGTYERLELFDKSTLPTPAPAAAPRPAPSSSAVDKRADAGVTAMASDYRSRLYKNPQSLAQVVTVSAVREGGELRGYRVSPGQDREQFEQFGFKPGDLVTSVNGVALDSPASTMKLYNLLRTASEVSFEVQRKDQPLTLSVSLDAAAQ